MGSSCSPNHVVHLWVQPILVTELRHTACPLHVAFTQPWLYLVFFCRFKKNIYLGDFRDFGMSKNFFEMCKNLHLDTPSRPPSGFSHASPSQHVSAWCSPLWHCSIGTLRRCLGRVWYELPGIWPSGLRPPTPSIRWPRS